MNEGRKEYTLLWFIENYSYCEDRYSLASPIFYTDGLDGTAWGLLIYPNGEILGESYYVSLELTRRRVEGPRDISLTFQFSLLAADGSAHHSAEFKHAFGMGEYVDRRIISKDELYVRRRAEYLQKDTLTVCCKMWTGDGDVLKAGRISARSRPITKKLSFSHVIERFSDLEPDEEKKILIMSPLGEKHGSSFSLCLVRDTYGEEKIIIEDIMTHGIRFARKFEFFLESFNGDLMNCGKTAVAKDNPKLLTLSLTRQQILNNKRIYLPDDKLSLVCECTFFNDLQSNKIEEITDELPLNASNQKRKVSDSKSVDRASGMMKTEHSGVSEDIKALYKKQCLTDVQLKTKTKSFAAHKLVLCIRSPVFKEILTTAMKEKMTDCIQVDDLEDDTVQQLLIFLYSDCLEPLQWRSATQLYYAADKYAVGKLQEMCSTFLVENITTSNAIELLLLADVHSDSSLKENVEGFILENDEQVFGSSEWEQLIETNPQLVIKTMLLKYKKKAN